MCCSQAVSGSPIKPSQAARDERGRVNLDELTDADLDYGTDERGLASLRRRLRRAIYTYEGNACPSLIDFTALPDSGPALSVASKPSTERQLIASPACLDIQLREWEQHRPGRECIDVIPLSLQGGCVSHP